MDFQVIDMGNMKVRLIVFSPDNLNSLNNCLSYSAELWNKYLDLLLYPQITARN